jgi:hydrogenase small subunit
MAPKTLYWLQCGACGGDSWSLAGVESPDFVELLAMLDIEVLWHPSLRTGDFRAHRQLLEAITEGEQGLDILCVEGSVVRGPGGTGMFDTFEGRPKKDLLAALARRARWIIAVGTCSSFGGIGASGDIDASGLLYVGKEQGGFLDEELDANAHGRIINLPGCPCHGEVIAGTLATIAHDKLPDLGRYHTPNEYYSMLVHQGCLRDEHHEFRVEERDFGEKGCLFFYMGCRGPLAHGPCNRMLWNRRSSKTRAGVPCVGCTEPDFPRAEPFFETRSLVEIPLELPEGVDRAHYLAYKGMAAAAAPRRLKKRNS